MRPHRVGLAGLFTIRFLERGTICAGDGEHGMELCEGAQSGDRMANPY